MTATTELTAVELDTLRQLSEGLTAPEIAAKSYMSLGAINSRVIRIRSKLGANTQAHAVALAYQRGVLVSPESEHDGAVHALAAALRQSGYQLTRADEVGAVIWHPAECPAGHETAAHGARPEKERKNAR